MIEFEPWPKIARLRRNVVITEKIDGTNAAVHIGENGEFGVQSRNRLITPGNDNFGFAVWAYSHQSELSTVLGPGRHFGEWWGSGIQRRYGLDEKRFSLFNTKRWADLKDGEVPGLYKVPVLYEGLFSDTRVDDCLFYLRTYGSAASPGFDKPEGVVVYHTAANMMFKVTVERDEEPKGGLVTG